MSKLETLRDKYFEALEENCVEFSYQEDIGNGQTETVIKEEYLYKSITDMCEYLDLPEWITDWTIDMIGEDLCGELVKIDKLLTVETDTEFGSIRVNNKIGGYLL